MKLMSCKHTQIILILYINKIIQINMRISIIVMVVIIIMISVYSCSNDETVVTPPSNDTLSYTYSNLNDSIITVNYAVGGSTSSQPRSYSINLNKISLHERFNMTYITNGSMTLNLYYESATDTILRFPSVTLSSVRDSTRNLVGPVTRLEIVPSNFKGRGSLYIYK
jgi:hypothetical protein